MLLRSQVKYSRSVDEFRSVLNAIERSKQVHALDFETTGLDPATAKVRLTSISGPALPEAAFVFDHFTWRGSFATIAARIGGLRWAVFNAGFEGKFIDFHARHKRVDLLDVGVMSKARLGGRPLSLRQQVQRDLDIELMKDEQLSDWTAAELTDSQIAYAGSDAYYTCKLYYKWKAELEEHGLVDGFFIMNDAWRGVNDMEEIGMTLDVDYHRGLISMWEKRRRAAEACLRRFTPESVLPNIRSKKQLSNLIAASVDDRTKQTWPLAGTGKLGQLDLSRNTLRQASFRAPYPFSRWLAALMVFNRADKYLGTYGEKLVNIMERAGSIKARYNIAQAVTGRFSSSEPNMQNIPRGFLVRRSFVAPAGATMLMLDYSGIELRVLAELSGDDQLRLDVIYGDVHAENAIIQGRYDREKFFAALKAKDPRAKEARARAKAFSFQLTYGAGVGALALALRSDDETAARHVDAWAKRYPKAFGYRTLMFEKMRIEGFLPTKNRTIYVHRDGRTIPVASNYPIQGTAAEVMYRAITRCEEVFYSEPYLKAILLATVHDELLSLTYADEPNVIDDAYRAQEHCMRDAWLDVFPGSDTHNLMEGAVGKTWAVKP